VTLREQITTDVSTVFLNEEDFAESCTYIPKGCASRTITAVVDELGSFVENNLGKRSEEFIDVFVSRSSTTGIDEPQLGDAFYRTEVDEETPDKGYSYTGEKSDVDENAWTLRFKRKIPYKTGGTRQT
jgi:hypothetical protein